jgi:hypothetical protein
VFNRVLTNVGDAYHQSTGVFTAPVDGLYTFHLHFHGGSSNDTTLDIFSLLKGSIGFAYAEGHGMDPRETGVGSAVSHLTKGEEISVRHYYGDKSIWCSVFTSFSGMLIHAD